MEEKEFIELAKKEGFEKALSISSRDKNKNWLCPACKSKVIITGERKFETLSEHVSDPNMENYPLRDAYQCSDENCMTRKNNIFWDYMGDRYGYVKTVSCMDDDKLFIDLNDAPFGSHTRKANVEIYKKGLKKQAYLSPIFCLFFLQPFIEYNYEANEQGEVLKKSLKIKFLKPDKNIFKGGRYCYLFNPFWETWIYHMKDAKRLIKNYRENKKPIILKNIFGKDDYWQKSKRFIHILIRKYLKLRYNKYYRIYIREKYRNNFV